MDINDLQKEYSASHINGDVVMGNENSQITITKPPVKDEKFSHVVWSHKYEHQPEHWMLKPIDETTKHKLAVVRRSGPTKDKTCLFVKQNPIANWLVGRGTFILDRQ